jgi:hypothetical protein
MVRVRPAAISPTPIFPGQPRQSRDAGFIRGELCFVWDAGDQSDRRLAAVQLVRIKAASGLDVAAASWFPPSRMALVQGAAPPARLALPGANPGKGPSRLSDDMVAEFAPAAAAAGRFRQSPTQSGCRTPRSAGHWPHPPQPGSPSGNTTSRRPQSWTCRYCPLKGSPARDCEGSIRRSWGTGVRVEERIRNQPESRTA